ncbi:exodeoxyribonuclease III [Candidatus Tokpelaia sp.]|uniref:exodeoxyribonuclease III n=1 Tax=Candidatus Tokpelaia sp. TaxID=2233777 RepID=UPI00123C66F5|nr:exodeoxyribonuclease III [Candidatus Tokpelaia sp.]KAA6405985.1 exodeoxyribonuclease III [Candidatus Tokpelaia sp.]
MRIATWNINGIKARLDNLLLWLRQTQPDIACLQEIKTTDSSFPRERIEDLGYYIETHGQKSFNGVALLSKMRPDDISRGLPQGGNTAEDPQARFIEGVYSLKGRAIRVASLYLPNGNPVWDDSAAEITADTAGISKKYAYKLAWIERLYHFARQRLALEEDFILAGDYNVIPAPQDAARPEQWQQDALFLPATHKGFRKLLNLGLTDALRAVSNGEAYTFWDYQAGAWPKNNGIRIDHMLLSPEAADRLRCAFVQKEIRGWEKASDHVPVWIEIAE